MRHPDLVRLEEDMTRLKHENASPSDIKIARTNARSLRASLMKKSLKRYQLEWVQERRDWKVITRGKKRAEDDINIDLSDILCIIMPERRRLARIMISDQVVTAEERKRAVQDLYTFIPPDCTTLYRPGEEPIGGICPVDGCEKGLTK